MNISRLYDELKVNFELKRMYYRMNKFAENSKSISPIFVTSAADGEGKTTIALLLSLIFIEEGKRKCLLFDANWKRPDLHKWFDIQLCNPASKVINDPASCVQNTGIEDLDIICAPRDIDDNPEWEKVSAHGAMRGFKERLNALAGKYDIIIIDGQSVFSGEMSILDPLYIASFAEYIIMAILMRRTDRMQIKRAKLALEDINGSLSVILNNVHNPIYAAGGKK